MFVVVTARRNILGNLKKGIQTPSAQGRSTKTISIIKWIRTSRLSMRHPLSHGTTAECSGSARRDVRGAQASCGEFNVCVRGRLRHHARRPGRVRIPPGTVTSNRHVQGEYRRVQTFEPGTSANRCVFKKVRTAKLPLRGSGGLDTERNRGPFVFDRAQHLSHIKR